MRINDQIELADWEFTESFTRASGPGGQHVNKVSTAVELRFEAARSPHLPESVKNRLKRFAGSKWTTDGAIVLRSEDTRSQARNREIVRAKLRDMILKALIKPKPRKATKPRYSAIQKRLKEKRIRSEVKSLRRSKDDL